MLFFKDEGARSRGNEASGSERFRKNPNQLRKFSSSYRKKEVCMRRSSTKFNLLIIALIYGLLSFQVGQAHAQPIEKPRVAIKTPLVGEGVVEKYRKHLNISKLLAEIEASLQATRKFEVLTRQKETLGAILKEQEFAKSDFAKGDAAQEGQFENANFLIVPTVQDFKFYRSAKPVPNISNKYIRRDSGLLEINAQVVDTESGAIKTTFYLKSSFGTKDEVVNSKGGSPSTVHFEKMAKKVSAQMADQLVDTVFPMRVLNSKGNQVWINRGKDGGLKVGDILNVYRPGEELTDPDTGERLGSAEMLIGKIKVARVNPKFTIAEIQAKGTKEPIEKGDIVRKP
jgi:hypothetical protein